MLLQLGLGLLWSALIALLAYLRGSLSRSGALAAMAVGTAIHASMGMPWFAALLVFFATSTLLGRVGRERKRELSRDYQKGDRRDASQVFCNGGVAALCAVSVLLTPSPWTGGAFLGALAAANGDTWATELGVLARGRPLSLRTFQRVPPGTSGAVTLLGVAATLLGGLAVGAVGYFMPRSFGMPAWVALAVGAGAGVLGSFMDSLLGATVQAGYHCPACGRDTESPVHHCGASSLPVRGAAWFDNDAVNLVATLTGAVVGGTLEFLLEPPLRL